MTDSAADEAANKALVLKLLTELFADRDVSALDRYYTDSLIQHDPQMPDGTAELRARVRRTRTCITRPAWSPPTGTS
jgi:predicted SnoaL-like aldol condensation-catalyzing enzyme